MVINNNNRLRLLLLLDFCNILVNITPHHYGVSNLFEDVFPVAHNNVFW